MEMTVDFTRILLEHSQLDQFHVLRTIEAR